MRVGLGIAFVTWAWLASAAAAQSPHRLVVIVGEPNDPRAVEENLALKRNAAELQARDVVVQNLTPEAARRDRPELGVGLQTRFEVLLVGKDGTVKLRREKPVAASEITALIDTMPMRQEEMKQGR